tara:strand:+ start:1712 stop:1957 length:246 start_codon:yes stop_codon:yes gene_type:complete
MARKKGTRVKKAIEKINTNVDKNRSLYNKLLCYTKCYGGYILAVGAGCTLDSTWELGVTLLLATAGWAYWVTCNNTCKLKK